MASNRESYSDFVDSDGQRRRKRAADLKHRLRGGSLPDLIKSFLAVKPERQPMLEMPRFEGAPEKYTHA
jgi:hypothetical protein